MVNEKASRHMATCFLSEFVIHLDAEATVYAVDSYKLGCVVEGVMYTLYSLLSQF